MYSLLHQLLSDKKGGEIFTLFGGWHFFYIALTLMTIAAVFLVLKNRKDDTKRNAPKLFIHIAFGLYITDFFLMPLAYSEIDIEKLPFHACTAMCVLCFLSYHNRFLAKYRLSFAFLGFLSNLVYLIYPAGVMWHAVHPLSYRVVQTLIFHSIMTTYGALVLIYEHDRIEIKKCYRDFVVIVVMTLWAMLGNYAYNGESEQYSHFFNWFFIVRDPFYAIPASAAPFIMPFLNVVVFFAAELALHIIFVGIRHLKRSKE